MVIETDIEERADSSRITEQDKEYLPEYYIRQEKNFEELKDANINNKENSVKLLDRVLARWNRDAPYQYFPGNRAYYYRGIADCIQRIRTFGVAGCSQSKQNLANPNKPRDPRQPRRTPPTAPRPRQPSSHLKNSSDENLIIQNSENRPWTTSASRIYYCGRAMAICI